MQRRALSPDCAARRELQRLWLRAPGAKMAVAVTAVQQRVQQQPEILVSRAASGHFALFLFTWPALGVSPYQRRTPLPEDLQRSKGSTDARRGGSTADHADRSMPDWIRPQHDIHNLEKRLDHAETGARMRSEPEARCLASRATRCCAPHVMARHLVRRSLAKCSRHRLVNLQRKARLNIGHRVAN